MKVSGLLDPKQKHDLVKENIPMPIMIYDNCNDIITAAITPTMAMTITTATAFLTQS